jgi:D-alanyl-D-alanine carboxypeptidase/D-alanyl-D-alanine-endopeptidase (penicillin-binding protein 4)
MKKLIALCLLLAAPLAAARERRGEKAFAKEVAAVTEQGLAARGYWGLEVLSLADKKILFSLNQDKLFTPASNLKLFTTTAALALIGPDYRFMTTVEAAAPADKDGRIAGNLTLVGRGDPNLSGREVPFNVHTQRPQPPAWVIEDFADQLARTGVKQIDGDIAGDDTFYAYDRYADGWAQDDLQWYYGAPVSALALNDSMMLTSILPGSSVGAPALLKLEPFTDDYQIENHIVTTAAGTPRDISIRREPGGLRIAFWGTIPLGDPGQNEELALEDPALFAAELLKAALEKRGVTVRGHAVARHLQLWEAATTQTSGATSLAASAAPAVLAKHDSQPFFEDLRIINKVSQNLHAELALRLLGKLRKNLGTTSAGLQAESEFLTQAGLQPEEYALHDGSGLSRQDVITPSAMIKLLQYASTQPWAAKFEDTLPVAATDGSLMDRFKNTEAAGRVRAKTGGMDHVNALSGYATAHSGRKLAFAIFINNHTLADADALKAIDRIVLAMIENF